MANAAMDEGMGRPPNPAPDREVNGIVRDGRVEFLGERLPDGTLVAIKPRRR